MVLFDLPTGYSLSWINFRSVCFVGAFLFGSPFLLLWNETKYYKQEIQPEVLVSVLSASFFWGGWNEAVEGQLRESIQVNVKKQIFHLCVLVKQRGTEVIMKNSCVDPAFLGPASFFMPFSHCTEELEIFRISARLCSGRGKFLCLKRIFEQNKGVFLKSWVGFFFWLSVPF